MSNGLVEHIGTKKVNAGYMNLGDYNKLRGWTMPHNEDPEADGMVVENMDAEPNQEGYEGRLSWEPIDVFEKVYKQVK